jgi:hypothetical protein
MAFPIKVCVKCGEEFELKPGKPGFANRCPECSEPEELDPGANGPVGAKGLGSERELNAARRSTIRDMLYRKDS